LEYKIQNFGGNLLYLGSTAGTSALLASGYPVPTTTSQIFVLEQGDVVYGLASTGTCDVRVLTAVLTRKQLRRL